MNNSQYPGGQGQERGGWGQPGANQPPGNYPPPGYGQAPYGYGYAPQVTTQYAGFWIRLVAFIIDIVILNAIAWTLTLVLGNSQFVQTIVYTAIFVGYYVLTAMYFKGASVGKKLLGLHVVNKDGSTPGLGNIAVRYLIGYILSFLIIGLGFIFIALDKQKQGLHDKIFSTYVVKG